MSDKAMNHWRALEEEKLREQIVRLKVQNEQLLEILENCVGCNIKWDTLRHKALEGKG